VKNVLKENHQVVDNPRHYWQVTPHAEHYDEGRFGDPWGRLYRACEERALRRALALVPRHGRVLDVACGTGRVTELLVREGFGAVAGTDVSPAMLDVARRRLPGVEFFPGDATRLPVDDRSFDAVTCIGLVMHLDDQTRLRVLNELARISRGPVIVQYGCVGAFLRLAGKVLRRPAGGVRYPVIPAQIDRDLRMSALRERARFWALRPVSSSLILALAPQKRLQ
jgi:SAM-dependent methyltransferase